MSKENGFEDWWKAWPANTQGGYQRKGGKSLCLKRWVKGLYWTQAETIIAHTQWMAKTSDWLKDRGAFVPMPITYLNQQRWDGAEIEPVKVEPPRRFIDPTLAKIIADDAKAVAPSAEIRAKLALLRAGK